MRLDSALAPEYSRSLCRGAMVVGLLFVLSALLVDGGLTARITLMAVLGYLAGVSVMAVRRPQAPTATDMRFLRWGLVPLWFTTQVCARCAWAWCGRL
jgi:hypothetical protein